MLLSREPLFTSGAFFAVQRSPTAKGNKTMTTTTGHYASVNGIELYYEESGTGEPLVLLHGGLGTIDTIFGRLLPALSAQRQVIAVELRGHGHTADNGQTMTYESMADDIGALIAHLELGRV